MEYGMQSNTSRLRTFIPDVNPKPLGMYLPRPPWVRLNCLRTGVSLFRSTMYRWIWLPQRPVSVAQTADHIITSYPVFHHPNRGLGLESVDDETVAWMNNTCPNICPTRKKHLLHTRLTFWWILNLKGLVYLVQLTNRSQLLLLSSDPSI